MTKIAVLTGSSASGLACLQKLLFKAGSSPHLGMRVRGCFRLQGKAATTRSSLPLQGLPHDTYEPFPRVDAADLDSLRKALEGMDRALLVTPLDYRAGLQDDAQKSINMITAAQEVGVQRIVHVGSWTVKAPQDLPILSSRFLPTEEYLRDVVGSSMEWTVLRGGYFMSNFAHVHGESIRSKERSMVSLPECYIPPVDVRDIGEAAAALLGGDHDDDYSNNYNQQFVECCGPELWSHQEMAAELSAGLGGDPISFTPAEPSEWSSENPVLSELYQYMPKGEGKQIPFDPEPFAKVLGRPLTTLREWALQTREDMAYIP